MTDEHVAGILRSVHIGIPESKPKFKIGDRVRVSTSKMTFEKGYEANYSDVMFEIVEARISNGHNLYKIVDLAKKEEPGWFYEQELSRVTKTESEKYRIAKIIRQRNFKERKQYLVNWQGYPSAFDSWEYADELE